MDGTVIQGLDLIDIIRFIVKKKKKFEAILLAELEEILPPRIQDKDGVEIDNEDFLLVRKLFLDGFNDYTRSILRLIFGDIEHLVHDSKTPNSSYKPD